MGAAGRDFHNFNVFFRSNPNYEVVAFTAAQIPGIEDKIYPPELAGKLYPEGIPIYSEEQLTRLIREKGIQRVRQIPNREENRRDIERLGKASGRYPSRDALRQP